MSDTKTVTVIDRSTAVPVPNYTFEQIKMMAHSFAKSGLYGIKDENQALALMMESAAQGRHPALIMKDFDMIGTRLAKKTVAMVRDFQSTGGRIEWLELTDTMAKAAFTHPLAPKPLTIEWDMERAKRAGLFGKTGDMYTKYARSMLRSRCASEGIRTIAPDATNNMYSPEEIRQMIEEETPEPVGITAAVEQATTKVKSELAKETLEALIMTMDVKTRSELVTAYNAAIKVAREAGDADAQRRLQSVRDDMLMAIEGGTI